jgi:hypothetical protein
MMYPPLSSYEILAGGAELVTRHLPARQSRGDGGSLIAFLITALLKPVQKKAFGRVVDLPCEGRIESGL